MLWRYECYGAMNAMNAARVCKLHYGVKKTPKFLLFSRAKGEPSAQ
jgi:hypothetical protein